MDNNISEVVAILHGNPSLIGIEPALETYFTDILCEVFSKALEHVDLELILDYKKKVTRMMESRNERFNSALGLLY